MHQNPLPDKLSRQEAIDILLATGMTEKRARWLVNGSTSINHSDDLSQLQYTPAAIREALHQHLSVAQSDVHEATEILLEYRTAIECFQSDAKPAKP